MQRAAAEKLFTHSGVQPAADSDSDAVVDAAGDNAEPAHGVPAAGVTADGYQAAEGKRQRQRLLSELREAVPAAAARLLADTLLDGNVCDPQHSTALRSATDQTESASRGYSPPRGPPTDVTSRTPERRHEQRVAAEVWRTAMAALAQQWTSLPGVLAAGAVARLLGAIKAGGVDDAERWAAWLATLLQRDEPSASPQKGGFRKQSPSQGPKRRRADALAQAPPEAAQPLWTPTPDQAADLVKRCLTAAAGVEAASARWQGMLSGTVSTLISAARPPEDTQLEELAQKARAQFSACCVAVHCTAQL